MSTPLDRSAGGRAPGARARAGTPSRPSPPRRPSLFALPDHVTSPTRSPPSGPAAPHSACSSWSRHRPTTSCWCPRRPVASAGCWSREHARPAPGSSLRPGAGNGPPGSRSSSRTWSWTTPRPAGRIEVRDQLGGVTLVYDGVGGDVGRACLELLRPGGRHVMFGFSVRSPDPFRQRRRRRPGNHRRLEPRAADDGPSWWHPRPRRPVARAAGGRGMAAARVDVRARGRGPRPRRPRAATDRSARSY